MTIRVDGGASQSVTFNSADFANIAAATAAEVAAVINTNVTGVTASDSGGAIRIMTAAKGENASIDIDDGTGMPAAAMGLNTSMVIGSQVDATASTDLNDMVSTITTYVNGDIIQVSGVDANGQAVDQSFIYGTTGTTLGDLRDFITSIFSTDPSNGSTATIDANGNLMLTADNTGDVNLSLFLIDNTANTGDSNWTPFTVTTDGAGPDEAVTSISIFDSLGISHTLTMTFQRTAYPPGAFNTWDLDISLPNGDGTISNNPITGIQFNQDGSFAAILGGSAVTINFGNGSDPNQVITFDLGTSGGFDGITMTGDTEALQVVSQDGYAAGDLASVSVDMDGSIVGLYTNGQFQDLGQIGLAMFSNPAGLEKEGDSVHFPSPNSGTPSMGIPGANGAGSLLAGTLEESNVDISEEFVNLIEAQRGFQANARIISTSNEVLVEAVNLV
jgi:flagellar hook protein FlgE